MAEVSRVGERIVVTSIVQMYEHIMANRYERPVGDACVAWGDAKKPTNGAICVIDLDGDAAPARSEGNHVEITIIGASSCGSNNMAIPAACRNKVGGGPSL